jgi:hypothetical protein
MWDGPGMEAFLLIALLIALPLQYLIIKEAVFAALEKHAKNMAIRNGSFDAETWQ